MTNPAAMKAAFKEMYGRAPRLFRAPGRVNLIGEHTDYNDGFVLPMAIDRSTFAAGAIRDDRLVRVHSATMDQQMTFDLDNPGPQQRGIWLDYVEGVAQALLDRLKDEGRRLRGADLLLMSDVPTGGGLSSSAALEISVGLALLALSGIEPERRLLALAGQQAEHDYVGAKVGIMDQWTSVHGVKGAALLLDCRSLETSAIPLDTSGVAIVVCDSHVKHELAGSEYNTRRAECERGVELLREFLPGISALRDVGLAEFERHAAHLPQPVRKRCRHVISENERTLAAADALRAHNLARAGYLMNQSHASLRDDYEVSCAELDFLTETALGIPGVLGARMTGGGFGGCTVNLVQRTALQHFTTTIVSEYQRAFNILPTVSEVEPAEGASELF
jgi:galactokinase